MPAIPLRTDYDAAKALFPRGKAGEKIHVLSGSISVPSRKCTLQGLRWRSRTQQVVLDLLHANRFVDKAPQEVDATLLDEGNYHCSIRTMYRILGAHTEVRERRNQLTHPRHMRNRNFWAQPRIMSGPGILPNCWVRPNGAISTSTSSWTSSAAMSSAG